LHLLFVFFIIFLAAFFGAREGTREALEQFQQKTNKELRDDNSGLTEPTFRGIFESKWFKEKSEDTNTNEDAKS
jgi:hypothetical protein